ncbi:prepilin peptidase-dependent pilin [Brenneria goodwinii]|uniref:Prepilin peptidase-dependent pilin n=1 Tax=Brenneria goodwinii TaxID=1109412 RepID=A0AAE8ELK5_9GAMM|nr:prepilin peptidase-dependent pilin [Brenneria goodwinii]ATA26723.1 pilus assembly protein [Brenneria goodwinii]MCG8156224.1 prepilin peptidase-dependent pilin [Brenneria goodwinii]MCG8161037.1 prepilin peptidase-dependent pilin [Brenneria goodwinii]MCG8167502.1 prepilin peptidase-dependent pilin [Brenneria goodwinii]MCG8169874.1 prepilin peptidase-dependent pilin [Brenneria goodwinii]
MSKQQGFTLVELMIVIAIVAILSAIGVPAYQGYLQKAAMTDMLQTMASYKTAVDLCGLENAAFSTCNAGNQGIPASQTSRYVSAVSVSQGVITLTGQSTLQGLSVVLTPEWDTTTSTSRWTKNCVTESKAIDLQSACQNVFRFDNTAG